MGSMDMCSGASVAFSEYYAGLTGPAKTRYREKLLTCGFDPYMLKKSECREDSTDYPSVEYPDIVNYLHWTVSKEFNTQKLLTTKWN